jgi:hypothetical protein
MSKPGGSHQEHSGWKAPIMRHGIAGLLLLTILAGDGRSARAGSDAAQDPPGAPELQKIDAALAFVRERNRRDYAITSPNGIDEAKYVTIGGIEQWITIRGEDRNNPVLLFLHGGRAMPPTRGAMPGSGCG